MLFQQGVHVLPHTALIVVVVVGDVFAVHGAVRARHWEASSLLSTCVWLPTKFVGMGFVGLQVFTVIASDGCLLESTCPPHALLTAAEIGDAKARRVVED